MKEKYEKLGQLIDDIDSLACGLELPLADKFHVEQLKKILPEKVTEFKAVFIEITNENPWE